MANVTVIRSIANSLLDPVSFIDGENNQLIFTVDFEGGWDGNMNIPWVGNQGEMNKCIRIIGIPGFETVSLFQDYWNPPNKDAVKYCYDGNYSSAQEVSGNNQGGGDKVLAIDPNGSLSMSS